MKKGNRAFKLVVTGLILFFIWILLAPLLASFLIVEKTLAKADVIFVLSGSATYIERNQKAAALYKQGLAPKIFLTNDGSRGGWNKIEQRNPYYVELARNNLINAGVGPENIEILPGQVSGTIDEAEALRRKIEQTGWKSVLIVTSPYHTRRSLWVFDKVLKNDSVQIGIVSPLPGEQSPMPFVWWMTSRGWNLVAGEYVKAVYYWFNY